MKTATLALTLAALVGAAGCVQNREGPGWYWPPPPVEGSSEVSTATYDANAFTKFGGAHKGPLAIWKGKFGDVATEVRYNRYTGGILIRYDDKEIELKPKDSQAPHGPHILTGLRGMSRADFDTKYVELSSIATELTADTGDLMKTTMIEALDGVPIYGPSFSRSDMVARSTDGRVAFCLSDLTWPHDSRKIEERLRDRLQERSLRVREPLGKVVLRRYAGIACTSGPYHSRGLR